MACKHSVKKLEESDRYHIYADEHNNCALCASEREGPMTQEKVGIYLGLTKMRISQIERLALKKLKNRMHLFFD